MTPGKTNSKKSSEFEEEIIQPVEDEGIENTFDNNINTSVKEPEMLFNTANPVTEGAHPMDNDPVTGEAHPMDNGTSVTGEELRFTPKTS